jgi:hypothetical protein
MAFLSLLLCLSIINISTAGEIFTAPAQVTKNYDFIVVG